MQSCAADPCLDAEPAARHQRSHQRRQIRADRAIRRASKNRKRNSVLRSGMRIEKYRDKDDRIPEQYGDQRFPPIHSRRDQTRRQKIGRNAMRHRDPQRGIVIRGPVAPDDRNRCKVDIVKRRRLDLVQYMRLEIDAAIGMSNCFGTIGHISSSHY